MDQEYLISISSNLPLSAFDETPVKIVNNPSMSLQQFASIWKIARSLVRLLGDNQKILWPEYLRKNIEGFIADHHCQVSLGYYGRILYEVKIYNDEECFIRIYREPIPAKLDHKIV